MTSPLDITRTRDLAGRMAALLGEARERTLLLVEPVSDADLRLQHHELQGPVLWDLGHIAHFESLWLTRNLDGPIEFVEMPGLYNPFEYPRRARGGLPLPSKQEMLALLENKRRETLDRLARTSFDDANPLLRDGFVYQLVAQHEYQHNETMLQTLQLKQGAPYSPARREAVPGAGRGAAAPDEVTIAGGIYEVGTDVRAITYDNERPSHRVEVSTFCIDTTPVTNAMYLEFMADGGYGDDRLWSAPGRSWKREHSVAAPLYWKDRDGVWFTRFMDQELEVPDDHPVIHVSYWEAEAFAAWAGKRLPTEAEWEIACTLDPAGGGKRMFPWGDEPATAELANVDQLTFSTAPVWSYPHNVSPAGCYGMIGDVWEWTSSAFGGYPGFESFPYPEYSEPFFTGEYRVLRGGSWATRPGAIRGTFRNWDYPVRRQIFSGFRCARDA